MKGFRKGEDEFISKPYSQLLYGTDNPPESCPFLEALEVGKPAECDLYHEELDTQFTVRTWPVVEHTGKVTAAIGMLREKSADEVGDDVRAREKFYRNLNERANAGVGMVGPDGAIQYANQRLCTMVDYTIDELLDRPVESIVAPEDQEALRECLAGAVDSGEAEGRLKLERSDAATLPTEARFGRFRADGETSLVLTFVEVGGLVEAEQEMWTDMKELNSILDEGIDKLECGVTVLDEDGRITWLNTPAAELLGQEREDLLGQPYLESLSVALDSHEATADDFLAALERAHEDLEALEGLDLPLVTGKGDALAYWSTPVHGLSAGVARVEHFYTTQKEVVREPAAEPASDLPPGLAEAVPDMLFSTGPDGQITWCNPAAVATAGYDIDSLRGMGLTDLAFEDSRNKMEYLVKNALNSCRRVEGEEVLLSRGDGRAFWAELTLLPVRNGQDGTAKGLHGSLRDVTERKINEAIHDMLENGAPAEA
jgi:PAS domain S-box-containing protein